MMTLFMATKNLTGCIFAKKNMLVTSKVKHRSLVSFFYDSIEFDKLYKKYKCQKIVMLFPIQNLKQMKKTNKNFIHLAL